MIQIKEHVRDLRVFIDVAVRLFLLVFSEQRKLVIRQIAFIALAAVAPFAVLYAFGSLIDAVTSKENSAWIWLILVVALSTLSNGASIMKVYQDSLFKYEIEYYFRLKILRKLVSLDVATIESSDNQSLFTRTREQLGGRVPRFITGSFELILRVLSCIVALVIVGVESPVIALLVTISVLPKLLSYFSYARNVWLTDEKISEARRKACLTNWNMAEPEYLSEIKLFQSYRFFLTELGKQLRFMFDSELETKRNHVKTELLTDSFIIISTGVALATFTSETLSGSMRIGTFTFLIASLVKLLSEINLLTKALGSQLEDTNFVKDIFKLFEIKPFIEENEAGSIQFKDQDISIEFKNVGFTYPGSKSPALQNLSFKINSKESIGLVGLNGAGKTTLIKLISRIYDPTEGEILVNGKDLKTLSLNSWQNSLGILLQDFAKYPQLTAKQNIGISDEGDNIDIESVKKASILTGADRFLSKLPNGYDTILGPCFSEGESVSGGEYQKIALARVLYRDPGLLILDEPTSSIDSTSEKEIFDNLFSHYGKATKVFISHRYNTLLGADRILVLEEGKLIESGTHKELLDTKGTYAQRFQEQVDSFGG